MQRRNINHWQGIDVSHWQGDIDWVKVREAGKRFAFIKTTEGAEVLDSEWKANAKGAERAELDYGFYHFARFCSETDALREAQHFLNTIRSWNSSLPHVLDLEITNGLSKEKLSRFAKAFLEKVRDETGHEVMLYTNTNMAKNHLTDILKEYPLWIAHYGRQQPEENSIWDKWRVFQYTNKGRVPGIRGFVDLDEMAVVEAGHTYVIQKGDTFWSLETKNGWPHGTIQKLNPGLNPRRLAIGTTIRIP
ncbi:MAG: GH25 family lysozyme [Tuberibacillus sp.]